MNIKRIVFIVLMVMLSKILLAQSSIEGSVIDKITGKVLLGVNIVVENAHTNTITNAQGKFIIPNINEGKHTVIFSHIGYVTQKQRINLKLAAKKLDIQLQPKIENIDEIVVEGKSEIRQIREQAMPVSVISMQQLSGTVTSISDVLTKTVGVTIRASGGVGSASRLSVRGLEGKRIGFFIDETPMNDHSDFVDINDIPMELIDRIEIYKGVVPAKFGGSSMGGAVNIVIKEYPERYADFSYTHESFNVHKVQTVLKRNIKDKGMTLGIGGGYTYADNNYTMESPYIAGLKIKRNHDQFKKLLVGGALETKNWWFDEVVFEPVFINTYRQIQGIQTNIREAFITSRAYILANNMNKNDFLTPGLDFDMSTATTYTQYSLVDKAKQWFDWEGNSYPTPSPEGGELGTRYASDSDNKKFTLVNKLNLEYLLNEQHSVNFNSYFTLANGKPKDELRYRSFGKQTIFDSKMRSWVAGATYDYHSQNNKFLNSFTTRYYIYTMKTQSTNIYGIGDVKNVSLNKSDVGISNAMRYHFMPSLMGKLSAGYDVRIPSETELLGDGYSITPAENLLPEQNTSINLGVLYDLTGKHQSNLQLEFGGFYMYLQDMIRFTKGFLGAQYQNFGEMKTLGVEFEAKADILPVLYGYGNITYQDLRDVRKYEENSTVPNATRGKRMPNIPYFFANAGLEFHKENLFGGKGQNTRLFSDMAFIEEYFYDFEVTQKQKRRIPRSTTIDLGFEHSFKNQSIFFSGKIKNLTNSKVLSEFNRPLPGRSFGIKLRYVFK